MQKSSVGKNRMADTFPKFPKFKKLELEDQSYLESFTNLFPPYSDFDFVNLSSWHGDGEVGVSFLHKNLVLSFPDYLNNQSRFTFLGNNDPDRTVEDILSYLKSEFLDQKLMYVPEVCLEGLDMSKFLVEIDFDNSDYVFDLYELSEYPGPSFAKKRQYAKSFVTKFTGGIEAGALDSNDPTIKDQLIKLYDHWSSTKSQNVEYPFLRKEKDAMIRFFNRSYDDVILFGVYVEGHLAAYSIYRLLPNNFAVCYFAKVNVNYFGLNEYLMKEGARFLLKEGATQLNYEEDMGIPGLRFSKNSFRPKDFLRKYTIQNK